ncbi:Fpg/Nei family DNA glycosylase [Psychromicrobium lacuslunae]|uniref:DNA-(apurinic or apyrimidinic site) lyase n=1 Tax=Psychromicrobium lacuslunae TaxID=1618207 RepID=A0A0D4C1D1_9MICC|nr:DNA-formamidopyrimidine glycosylase family protein [Psychromicrobium lacuslunae]AJT42151.1 DNA glycosylase [Psychromicrobium lacuslunae]
MPEGDTVWRQAKRLENALLGKVLTASDLRVPAFATADLSGYTVTSSIARGKHLLLRCEPRPGEPGQGEPVLIHSHLKMEGSWQLYRAGERWRRPAHTARIVLHTADTVAVGFSLGILQLLSPEAAEQELSFLGPDLLGPDWDAAEALSRLLSEPQRAIGLALLDQRNLAGIGNIYRNELCFLSRIHPTRPVREVADLARMVDQAKRLLEANKQRAQRNTTGGQSRLQSWVYARAHEPCLRCGALIVKADFDSRPIYSCPRCQPLPAQPSATGKIRE